MRAKNRPERICQATLLAMGWTKSMIARLLPEPELVDNPHYKCASPMKLWDKRMVLSLMDTDAFNKLALEGARRSQASKRAFQTRKQNLQEEVLRIAKEFSIPLLNDEELREKAIDSRVKYYEAIENEYENEYYDEDEDDDEDRRYDEPFTINHLTEETISRWVVNYIRHELIDYD